MDRSVPFGRIVTHATAHFVTRQLFTGAGKIGSEAPGTSAADVPYQLTPARRLLRGGGRPRDHAEATDRQHARRAARRRPEVPAAPRDHRRRQPVRGRDVPQGRHHRDRAGDGRGRLPAARLRVPQRRSRRCARCPTTSTLARPLELVDGTTVTALDVQWELFDRARKYAEEHGLEMVGDATPAELVLERWEAVLDRPRVRPDVAGRPASTGWPSTACSTATASATTSRGTTPGSPPWTCSTTTCGPSKSLARRVGLAAGHRRRRGRAGDDRAARGHPGLLPGHVPAEVGRPTIVAANWDSLVFDVGARAAAPCADDGTDAWNQGPRRYVVGRVRHSGRAGRRGLRRLRRVTHATWLNESRRRSRHRPSRTSEVDEAPAEVGAGREDQGRARRPARRDRRGARDQRRGLRPKLRPEGRRVDGLRSALVRRCRRPRPRSRSLGSLPLDEHPVLHPGRRSGARLRRAAASGRPAPRRSPTARRPSSPITHGTTVRRHPLRRRRGHGRRPAGHVRQLHHPPRDREGVPRRPLLRRRHRRRGRSGHGDGEAVPAAARALREGRGRRRSASRARPTSSRRWSAATCRPPCRAWPSCRCSPATTCDAQAGRLFQYDVTGGRYEENDYATTGSGSAARRHGGQARLPRRASAATRRSTSPSRRCSRRPTRTPPPAAPTWCAASSPSSPPSPPTASSGSPTTELARALPGDRSDARARRCGSSRHRQEDAAA